MKIRLALLGAVVVAATAVSGIDAASAMPTQTIVKETITVAQPVDQVRLVCGPYHCVRTWGWHRWGWRRW